MILNTNYCSIIIYDTKLNFIIIKSISIFQFVLNYKFHHNVNFKKDSIIIFFKKGNNPLILKTYH